MFFRNELDQVPFNSTTSYDIALKITRKGHYNIQIFNLRNFVSSKEGHLLDF